MLVVDVVRKLMEMGLTGITLELRDGVLGYNLNTGAKSGMTLLENFTVLTRYNEPKEINPVHMNDAIESLFWIFMDCICGRDFCNNEWNEIGVQLGILEKQVETTITTRYI